MEKKGFLPDELAYTRNLLKQSGMGLLNDTLWVAPKRHLTDRLVEWDWILKYDITAEHYETVGSVVGAHTRVYFPTVRTDEASYIPTLLVGEEPVIAAAARREGQPTYHFEDIAVRAIVEQWIPHDELAATKLIAGMESTSLACFFRKSSLLLQHLTWLRDMPSLDYFQIRLHKNVVISPDRGEQFVGFAGRMHEREPLWDGTHCIMFTNSPAVLNRNATLAWSLL